MNESDNKHPDKQDHVNEDSFQFPDDNEYGFFINCDLDVPGSIKESTHDYPFFLIKLKLIVNFTQGI